MNDLKRKHMARKGIPQRRDPRNVLSHSHAVVKPLCFESALQYRQYVTLMRQAARPKDDGYCLDCTPEFKTQMLEEGRCSHPETRFALWKDHATQELEIIGVSDTSRFWGKVLEGNTIINGEEDGEDQ